MFFQNINYLVVIIATLAGMIIGFLWYAPWAFGKLYMKSKSGEVKAKAPVWVSTTISTLVTAFVLATIFNSLIIVGLPGIIVTVFLLWVGFSVPMKLNDYNFGSESLTLFLISIGHELAVLIFMSLIIGIFG